MPRSRTVVWLSDAVLVTLIPETRCWSSLMSRAPASCSSCSGSTLRVIGTSCSASSRFCAVTIRVSSVAARSPDAGGGAWPPSSCRASSASAVVATPHSASATEAASKLRWIVLPFMGLPSRNPALGPRRPPPPATARKPRMCTCPACRSFLPHPLRTPLPSVLPSLPLAARPPPHVRDAGPPPSRLRRLGPGERLQRVQVLVGRAHAQLERQQPPEAVADVELVGHAHAAVQLDRLLADPARGLADHDLGARDRLPARGGIAALTGGRGQVGHRTRLFDLHVHVGHAVLQRLEAADRRAELHAVAGVLHGRGQGAVEHAQRIGAQRRDPEVERLVERRGRLPAQ